MDVAALKPSRPGRMCVAPGGGSRGHRLAAALLMTTQAAVLTAPSVISIRCDGGGELLCFILPVTCVVDKPP